MRDPVGAVVARPRPTSPATIHSTSGGKSFDDRLNWSVSHSFPAYGRYLGEKNASVACHLVVSQLHLVRREDERVIHRRRPPFADVPVRCRREESLMGRGNHLSIGRDRKRGRPRRARSVIRTRRAARRPAARVRQRDEERFPELLEGGRGDTREIAEWMRPHRLDADRSHVRVVGVPSPESVGDPDDILELSRPSASEELVQRDPVRAVGLLGQQLRSHRVRELPRGRAVFRADDVVGREGAVEREERSRAGERCSRRSGGRSGQSTSPAPRLRRRRRRPCSRAACARAGEGRAAAPRPARAPRTRGGRARSPQSPRRGRRTVRRSGATHARATASAHTANAAAATGSLAGVWNRIP